MREPSCKAEMQTANLEPGCWFWIMSRNNSLSTASFLWHVAWFCRRERKGIRKSQKLTEKCSVGPGSEGTGSNLALSPDIPIFVGPGDTGRRVRFVEGAEQNSVVCDFPVKLNFLFLFEYSSGQPAVSIN